MHTYPRKPRQITQNPLTGPQSVCHFFTGSLLFRLSDRHTFRRSSFGNWERIDTSKTNKADDLSRISLNLWQTTVWHTSVLCVFMLNLNYISNNQTNTQWIFSRLFHPILLFRYKIPFVLFPMFTAQPNADKTIICPIFLVQFSIILGWNLHHIIFNLVGGGGIHTRNTKHMALFSHCL